MPNNTMAPVADTWGHLLPKKGYYEGVVRVAKGVYGDVIILDDIIDIVGSPWWFEAIREFVDSVEHTVETGEVVEFAIGVKVKGQNFDIKQLKKTVLVGAMK